GAYFFFQCVQCGFRFIGGRAGKLFFVSSELRTQRIAFAPRVEGERGAHECHTGDNRERKRSARNGAAFACEVEANAFKRREVAHVGLSQSNSGKFLGQNASTSGACLSRRRRILSRPRSGSSSKTRAIAASR